MNDQQKVKALTDLLAANGNKVTVTELLSATGSERRARRAVFMARKAGLKLEAVRDGGRGVVAYVLIVPATNAVTFDEAVSRLQPKRELAKARKAQREAEKAQRAAEKAAAEAVAETAQDE